MVSILTYKKNCFVTYVIDPVCLIELSYIAVGKAQTEKLNAVDNAI